MEGMGKHPRDNSPSHGDLTSKKLRPVPKDLYVALDDFCLDGFSIHKIDMRSDGLESNEVQDCVLGLRHLPEPPALRINAGMRGLYSILFAAMGRKFFISAGHERISGENQTYFYDTETRLLITGPRLPIHLCGPLSIAMVLGETVYLLAADYYDKDGPFNNVRPCSRRLFEEISWSPMGVTWKSLCAPPFGLEEYVISYAVHPDECTIFMTTYDMSIDHEKGTYTFDTKNCVWNWHGKWTLPFRGQGIYDSELGAWVGLHLEGYICSCEVATPGTSSSQQRGPPWVKGKQKLFKKDPDYSAGATLTCMGINKFCLVESVARRVMDDVEVIKKWDRDTNFLHLTMFSLDYNREKRKLQASIHAPTHTYLVPQFTNCFPLQAISM